ncbi:sulfonate ABC transporter substrate-binding protein [Kibdelosporangium phytohabitans]|uniref:Sulfonate ABC transporter substrate-binding protein n=2 Tax=Kibdelosporangium phytohabitans TaxID=860235 RepID=A0A0N9HYA6_9PSEU|nr:ABC transporter substrate-binding protein [Kibdelosporangium phytohabitans]ALG07266.1 sulfonate ABC transporter substrate-binding protein [Kibdelosporangium phytohabitans]
MLGVAGLSGCSSSTASSSAKLTIGFSAWPGWIPWQVAADQGLFKKNGLDVELKWFDVYTDSINALATGAIDANSQTLNDTLTSVSGGAKQTVVLVNDNSTGNDKIIAREGINSVGDLKGKKVAVEQGTVDHYLLLLALAEAKLTEKDIELTPMATDAAAAAFVAGKIDAVGAFAPFTTKALERPGSRPIATSAEFPGAIPDHLVFKAEVVKNNPQAVQGMVNTWFETVAWIKANRQQAMDIMSKRGGVSVKEYEDYDSGTSIFTRKQNLDAFTPGTTPQHLNHQARLASDFLMNTGLAKNQPNLDGLFDDTFVKAVKE